MPGPTKHLRAFRIVSVVFCVLLAAVAVGSHIFFKLHSRPMRDWNAEACFRVLLQFDGAKEQWALEHKKQPADLATVADLRPYIKESAQLECPKHGRYNLGALLEPATCSVHGSRPQLSAKTGAR